MQALPLDPVGHAQERRLPPSAQIAGRRADRGGDVAARRDDAQPRERHTLCLEVGGQRLASDEQSASMLIGQPVQPGLDGATERTVIDTTRRLMEHPNQGKRRLSECQPGPHEGSGDAIENQDVGAQRSSLPEHGRRVQPGQWKGAVREGYELDATMMTWGKLSESLMIQVAARQSARVAER